VGLLGERRILSVSFAADARLLPVEMSVTRPIALGIETSCDDTACAVVDGDGRVLSSTVSSQLEAHRPFGGVVPEIASREHLRNWPAVSEAALQEAGVALGDVDIVAATKGPGLIGSLLVGLSLGKAIAYAQGSRFHAVHHLEGHLFSPFLEATGEKAERPPEEFIGLVVSGGHTSLYEVKSGETSTLAETRDDAMGEVFDKVGKRLGLPYPQGPLVDKLAETGDGERFPLPIARCSDGSLDFSYSGLKSQTLVEIQKLESAGVDTYLGDTTEREVPREVVDLLAGFRRAAVGQLVDRLARLREQRLFRQLAVSGGVAANRLLRPTLEAWAEDNDVNLRLVALRYSGDNAAMIAHAALLRDERGLADDPLEVDAASRIPL
jgi:N6-L-threonylcarbamoyladenine synthase